MGDITISNPPVYVAGAGNVGINGGLTTDPAFSYLTPDALMAYCETKLQSTDSQMESHFEDEQQIEAQQKVLTNLETALDPANAGFDSGQCHTGLDSIAACQAAIDAVGGENTPVGKQIAAVRDNIASALDVSGSLKRQLDAPGGGDQFVSQYKAQFASDPSMHDADYVKTHGGPNDGQVIASTTAQSWAQSVQQIGSNLGNDSQMGMIQLQSLMSDRQTSIQMCTNLVQSLADQSKGITSNIGH